MSYEDKVKEQAVAYLLGGEAVVAAIIARPRGAGAGKAGGLAPALIAHEAVRRQKRAGEQAGLKLAAAMALVLTDRRLLILRITPPGLFGSGAEIQELLSEAPLTDVESIDAKRLLVGGVVILTVRGSRIKLETGSGARRLAEEFTRCRTALLQT